MRAVGADEPLTISIHKGVWEGCRWELERLVNMRPSLPILAWGQPGVNPKR